MQSAIVTSRSDHSEHGKGNLIRGAIAGRIFVDRDEKGAHIVSADANLKTIQMVYEAFGRGDLDAILATVTDEVDWAAEAAGSGAPWYGPHKGPEGVTAFFTDFASTMEVEAFVPLSFATNENEVHTVVHCVAKSPRQANGWTMTCTTTSVSTTGRSPITGAPRTRPRLSPPCSPDPPSGCDLVGSSVDSGSRRHPRSRGANRLGVRRPTRHKGSGVRGDAR